jgi:hypothetical protein
MITLLKQQNDHIAQLSAKINEREIENEKFKFASSMLYSGRRPGIKDGIGFQQGSNVKLMLGNLILFHIMLLCIKMRLLALGNQSMLNCLKRKLLLHQINLIFHLRLLMLLMC